MAAHSLVQVPGFPRLSPVKVYTTRPGPSRSTRPFTPATCCALNTIAFLDACCGAPNATEALQPDIASSVADTTLSTTKPERTCITAPFRDPAFPVCLSLTSSGYGWPDGRVHDDLAAWAGQDRGRRYVPNGYRGNSAGLAAIPDNRPIRGCA